MMAGDTGVNQGGLMRCCLQSLDNAMRADLDREVVEGEVVSCEFETTNPTQMIYRGDAWEWNRPES